MGCGMWVLSGFLIFVIAEKLFNTENIPKNNNDKNEINELPNIISKTSNKQHKNNNCNPFNDVQNCIKVIKNRFIKSKVMKISSLRKEKQQNDFKNFSSGVNYKNYNGYENCFITNNGTKDLLNIIYQSAMIEIFKHYFDNH
jgi:hypothetical protein